MQMTGSGIICNGYFYYNPKSVDYGTLDVRGSESNPTTNTYAPKIGEGGLVRLYNSDDSTSWYKVTFSGTYVGPSRIGSHTIVLDGSISARAYRYVGTGTSIRYA